MCVKKLMLNSFHFYGVKVYKTPEQREEDTQRSIRVSKSKDQQVA